MDTHNAHGPTGFLADASLDVVPNTQYRMPVLIILFVGRHLRLRVLQLRGGEHPGGECEQRLPTDQPRHLPLPWLPLDTARGSLSLLYHLLPPAFKDVMKSLTLVN